MHDPRPAGEIDQTAISHPTAAGTAVVYER
jgi:hypothetical protein